jgi:hypothetical protein
LEKADQRREPHQFQTPHHSIFSVQILKNLLFSKNNRDLRHPREEIITYLAAITSEMLRRIWQVTENRLDIFKTNNGKKVDFLKYVSKSLSVDETATRISILS